MNIIFINLLILKEWKNIAIKIDLKGDRLKIIKELCAVCEICIPVCPLEQIRKRRFTIEILDGCNNCEECLVVCPVGAIESED